MNDISNITTTTNALAWNDPFNAWPTYSSLYLSGANVDVNLHVIDFDPQGSAYIMLEGIPYICYIHYVNEQGNISLVLINPNTSQSAFTETGWAIVIDDVITAIYKTQAKDIPYDNNDWYVDHTNENYIYNSFFIQPINIENNISPADYLQKNISF